MTTPADHDKRCPAAWDTSVKCDCGAADLPEALRPVKPVALIASIQELNAWEARADGELLTPAEGESIILVLHELKRLLALAAGQATTAQAVVPAQPVQDGERAYPPLPAPSGHIEYPSRPYESAWVSSQDAYSEEQMRAFADATYALRASQGQAPATVQADSVQEDALSDSVRTPLDSLHADAAYLIGRLRDGSMPYVRVIEIIRERIDAAKAAIRARASHGQAPANPSPPDGTAWWISVDERLPGEQGHDSEQVLVFINGHCKLTDMECRQGGAWGLRLGYFDADRQVFRVHGRPEPHVTHWRQEPPAPPLHDAPGHSPADGESNELC